MDRRAFKDKDLMSDTGGISKVDTVSKDRPPRTYDKNISREKKLTRETRDDMSCADPDLVVSSRRSRFDAHRQFGRRSHEI